MTDDPIAPAHYRFEMADGRPFEAIDVIRAVLPPEQLIGYCRGTKIAYQLRAGRKPGSPLVQDEMKGQWSGRTWSISWSTRPSRQSPGTAARKPPPMPKVSCSRRSPPSWRGRRPSTRRCVACTKPIGHRGRTRRVVDGGRRSGIRTSRPGRSDPTRRDGRPSR